MRTNWMRTHGSDAGETLLDLIFGCIIYSLFFELIGLLVVENKGTYSLGLLVGTLASIGLSFSMYRSVEKAVTMDPGQASRSMTIASILRMLVILVVAWLGMRFAWISFPGILIGILGLKISAYLHVYTNVYITRKIRKNGR